jgi:hypothetical protein
MQQRIVWVHGIGIHHPGYSQQWQINFNRFLQFDASDYLEVCWDTVFQGKGGPPKGLTPKMTGLLDSIKLTPREKQEEAEVRDQLATILLARSQALAMGSGQAILQPKAMPGQEVPGRPVIEWSELGYAGPGTKGFLPDWLTNPDAYLGDFTKYLVSRQIRSAVKEKFKEILRPLAGSDFHTAVISHSWGTVVAYDSLLDLQAEVPALQLANLFTLGSPLWLVRPFLEDRSGRKPGEVGTWVNIHAAGDLVGSWLSRGFKVDKEFEVVSMGNDAHASYFEPENEVVQKDIVAHFILI